jgi:tRNA U34 5-carboxymethylaminomethyl modifying GTPase MnmE/TrmE
VAVDVPAVDAVATAAADKPLQLNDTIVAVSTPPGRGALGIIRLSGSGARGIAHILLRPRTELKPRKSTYAELVQVGQALQRKWICGV